MQVHSAVDSVVYGVGRDAAMAASRVLEAGRCIASPQPAVHPAVRLAQVQVECWQCTE